MAITNTTTVMAVRDSVDDPLPNEGPELARLYDGYARSACFVCSVIEIICGSVMIVTFWAAYGWTFVHAVVALTMGSLGCGHYASRQALGYNTWCCHPLPFISNQHYIQICLAVFTAIAAAVSIIAAVYSPSSIFTIMAAFNIIACLVLFVTSIVFAVFNSRLEAYANGLQVVIWGNAPVVHVVQQPSVMLVHQQHPTVMVVQQPQPTVIVHQQQPVMYAQPQYQQAQYVQQPQPMMYHPHQPQYAAQPSYPVYR